MKPWVSGSARLVLVVAACVGVAQVALTTSGAVDLGAPSGSASGSASGAPPGSGAGVVTEAAGGESGRGGDAFVVSSTLACVGPELSGVAGARDTPLSAIVAADTAPTSLLGGTPSGAGSLVVGGGDAAVVARGDVVSRTVKDAAPVVIATRGALAPGASATQEWFSVGPEVRGLSTTPCTSAGTDLWLVAGGGGPGRQERLVLANPGGNAVTATVTVHGAGGAVVPGRGPVAVPAHGRVAILLDATAAAENSPAVHVVTDGGGVVAVLTDVRTTGSKANGADAVGPVDAPSTRQTLPVAVANGGFLLRVVVPGATEAVVSARVLGPKGPIPLKGNAVHRVSGRSTLDIPITGVPDGVVSVEVTADVPVVVGALTVGGSATGPGDLAWSGSTAALPPLSGLVLPPHDVALGRTLVLVSSGTSTEVTVTTVVRGVPTAQEVSLRADSPTSLALQGAQAVWVSCGEGASKVRGAVVSTVASGAARLISVAPLAPVALRTGVSTIHPAP